jgi:two-component sensor histidine kinase
MVVAGSAVDEAGTGHKWRESDRLAALRSYHVLDTAPEPAFDSLVQMAAQVCDTPIAAINLIEDRRQWFKAEVGLGFRETPVEVSICAKAILQRGLFIVPDITQDSRFASNPLVTGPPHVRFYAGALLETPQGLPLGTLCVLDYEPRELNEQQRAGLTTLAAQVMAQLELRRMVTERDEAVAASRRAEQRQALLVRELHHRVRNALATVQALLGASARSSGSVDELYRAFSARIASLAKTQTLLTEDYWQTAPFRAILEQELQPFMGADEGRFVLKGPPVELAADLAVPVGMAVHELARNARMHGALSVATGWIAVKWEVRQAEGSRAFRLEWAEHDGPPMSKPLRSGFGLTLLERALPMQAKAKTKLSFNPNGLRFEMEAPWVEQRLVPEY